MADNLKAAFRIIACRGARSAYKNGWPRKFIRSRVRIGGFSGDSIRSSGAVLGRKPGCAGCDLAANACIQQSSQECTRRRVFIAIRGPQAHRDWYLLRLSSLIMNSLRVICAPQRRSKESGQLPRSWSAACGRRRKAAERHSGAESESVCLGVESCRNTTRLKTSLAELLRRVSRRPCSRQGVLAYRIYAVVPRGPHTFLTIMNVGI
jgi:hypothetical protein